MDGNHGDIRGIYRFPQPIPWDRTPGQPEEYVGRYKGMNKLASLPLGRENS